jgi:nucleotide-binding universal stress UspA family protein
MIGADLTQMDDDTLALLTNTDLLALLSKDCSGRQVYRRDDSAVWSSRNRATGEIYVALFNLSDAQAELSAEAAAVAEALGVDPDTIPKTRLLYDIWEKTTEEQTGSTIRAAAAPHGVRLFRIAAK